MRLTQYVRQEKAIAAADKGGIRERWLWGLRLLRDPESFNPGSSQLRPGLTDQLIAAVAAVGGKLSGREIRYRLRCARTYSTEAEIRQATAEFPNWSALIEADFPPFEVPEGEPLADHRTDAERQRDAQARLMDLVGEQGALFPLDEYEPTQATLKELVDYTTRSEELTDRFARRDRERREYVTRLARAVDGDLSVTWAEALRRLDERAADTRT